MVVSQPTLLPGQLYGVVPHIDVFVFSHLLGRAESTMVKLLSGICVALMLNNLLGLALDLGPTYYIAMGVVLTALVLASRTFHVDWIMFGLYSACVASLVANEVPGLFRSWERLLTFLVFTAVLSPFMTSDVTARFRVMSFWYLQWSMLVVTGVSAVLFLLGFRGFDVGYYSGLTSHSMLMGPVAACSALFALFLASSTQYRSNLVVCVLLWCLAAGSVIVVLLSSSRAAIAALMVSVFSGVLLLRKRLASAVFYGLVVGLIASVVLFQWGEVLTEGLSRKGDLAAFATADSRLDLWNQRIAEFRSSPLFGVGFGAVDLSALGGSYYPADGKVETGTSWLAIASMLGIPGCLAFLGIAIRSVSSLRRVSARSSGLVVGYLSSLLAFWATHMLAEGYILAAGSFLFANVWLLLGVVGALHSYPELDLPPASKGRKLVRGR